MFINLVGTLNVLLLYFYLAFATSLSLFTTLICDAAHLAHRNYDWFLMEVRKNYLKNKIWSPSVTHSHLKEYKNIRFFCFLSKTASEWIISFPISGWCMCVFCYVFYLSKSRSFWNENEWDFQCWDVARMELNGSGKLRF